MMKISKKELLTILAATGLSSSAATSIAANLDSGDNNALGKIEHSGAKYLAEANCGKGSCGKNEKGAEAANRSRNVR